MPTSEDRLRELARTPAQADTVIECARRLGCWPHDTVIAPDTASDHLVVVVGVAKGRGKTLTVGPDGTTRRL